jgi:NADPH-dependent glutamate synthase beta subunit-like oxidoreductase
MEACNRREYDERVNVRDLERAAAERGSLPEPTLPWRDGRIGVIGSGPAGLSAAYHLARLGYPVTIFESSAELGGVLRHGIPPYRLPRDVLDAEVRHILRHGLTVELNHAVNRSELLRLSRQFAALFVATGLQKLQDLHLGARTGRMVMQGIDFLDQARNGRISLTQENVVVVGGGNTAIDAARSARRLGARCVRILYRRNREAMPAISEEIDHALEEGITLDELVMPLRIHDDGE